ncbi:MAG: hypothetical protein ACE5F1_06415 [Planctomycetota bacterium]
MTKAFPSAPSVLLIGAKALNVQIPGTNSFLLTEPVFIAPVHTDVNGRASRTIAVPRTLVGSASLQVFSFNMAFTRFTSSNGLRLDCMIN